MTGFRNPSKRIMYLLYKKTNRTLSEFRRGRGEKADPSNLQILRRLRVKKLVGMTEYPTGNIYYLTEEGDKIVKPIVNEIDEYKSW